MVADGMPKDAEDRWSSRVSIRIDRPCASPTRLAIDHHPDERSTRSAVCRSAGSRSPRRLDLKTRSESHAVVADLRAVGWQDIALDLRDVAFLDSTAFSWLLSADRDARADESTLSLVGTCPAVARLLELSGLQERFTRGL